MPRRPLNQRGYTVCVNKCRGLGTEEVHGLKSGARHGADSGKRLAPWFKSSGAGELAMIAGEETDCEAKLLALANPPRRCLVAVALNPLSQLLLGGRTMAAGLAQGAWRQASCEDGHPCDMYM